MTKDSTDPGLLAGQNQILEMVAAGKPRDETLTALVRFVESHVRGMICTVLLLDEEEHRLWTAAAPNLPASLSAAIDGSEIGPSAGSCGTAAFRGENVLVEDISSDPLWTDYKNVFLLRGLRACWSSPIFDDQRKVLGTFAMYHKAPAAPEEYHLRLMNIATRMAALAIMRHRSSEFLRQSEQLLKLIYNNLSEVVYLLEVQPDFRFRFLAANQAFLSSSGLRLEQVIGKPIEKVFPPSMHQNTLDKYRQAIQEKRSIEWDDPAAYRNDGRSMMTAASPIFDERGTCTHVLISARI